MAQFQGKIIQENQNTVFDTPLFKIPADCPKSFIVWGENGNSFALTVVADQLYKKYVKEGSDFEINLRYKTRKDYQRMFEKEELSSDLKTIYHVFDEVIAEMIKLLVPAFERFTNTKQYEVKRASIAVSP